MLAMNLSGTGGTGLALKFASEIKKRRAGGLQSSNWKWHLDEVFVKDKWGKTLPLACSRS